jgi:uncharacterized protein YfaP (DUF2135 family)
MRLVSRAVAIVVACCVAGCAAQRVAPPAVPATAERGLVVTLAWSAAVDLDLYVTTPGGETIYYANPRDAFVRDARCADGDAGSRSEAVRWRTPAPGRYRLGVDFQEACAGDVHEAPYRLVVDLDGARTEHEGVARLLVREPWVAEVDVP